MLSRAKNTLGRCRSTETSLTLRFGSWCFFLSSSNFFRRYSLGEASGCGSLVSLQGAGNTSGLRPVLGPLLSINRAISPIISLPVPLCQSAGPLGCQSLDWQ